MLICGLFAGFIVYAMVVRKLPFWFPALYFFLSCISFMAYWIDKSAAQAGRQRTRENSLQLLSLMGGWPGALLAQRILRHKSRKQSFRSTFWCFAIINMIAAILFAYPTLVSP